jgi:hypothetical protein
VGFFMNDLLKNIIKQFIPFAQKQIGFKNPPRLFLRNDQKNANNPLGKTAFYDPAAKSVTLYVTGRHPKDILRSLGHELVHHKQNCEGHFDNCGDMGAGYAQKDPHLRQMEMDANRDGSMCLRDFEDMLKKENTIYYEHLQRGENKMSTKDWKNKEAGQLIAEAWGFKFNSLQEFDEFNGAGEIQAEGDGDIEELAQAKHSGDRRKPHKRTPVRDDEEKVDESGEEVDEGLVGAAMGGAMGGPVGAYAGHKLQQSLSGDDEEEEEVNEEEVNEDEEVVEESEEVNEDEEVVEESEEETLQEAITRILRKHLKG